MTSVKAQKTDMIRMSDIPFESLKKRILVIEEEQAVRCLFSLAISRMGYDVTVVSNGKDGLDSFQKGYYDLVISDLGMIPMDGWTLVRHIKEISSHTPVGLMTGQVRDDIMPELRQSNAEFVLFRPCSIYVLKKIIERFLFVKR